jgi:hypothetical protein
MLALEHNGKQHYEPLPFFGGIEQFCQTQTKDLIKRKLCYEHAVRLIDVPHWISVKQITVLIRDELIKLEIPINEGFDLIAHIFLPQKSKQEEITEIITSKGGVLLSGTVVTNNSQLRVQCKEGHIWEPTAGYIKHDRWCATCVAETQFHTEQGLIAREKISETLKTFYATPEGKANKATAHAKRSETMAKEREELQRNLTEKECGRCKRVLPVNKFCKKKAAKNGLQPYCKECQARYKEDRKKLKLTLLDKHRTVDDSLSESANTCYSSSARI